MIFIGKLRTPLKIDKNVQLTVLSSKVKLFNKAGAVNEQGLANSSSGFIFLVLFCSR